MSSSSQKKVFFHSCAGGISELCCQPPLPSPRDCPPRCSATYDWDRGQHQVWFSLCFAGCIAEFTYQCVLLTCIMFVLSHTSIFCLLCPSQFCCPEPQEENNSGMYAGVGEIKHAVRTVMQG
eukprot:1151426-Pelagomonas_calceolata.AAC.10